MTDLSQLNDRLQLVLTLGAVLALFVTWTRFIRPRGRRLWAKVVGIFDAILGREEITDSITGERISPALPGIGARMATQEAGLAQQGNRLERLTQTVETLARVVEHQARLDKVAEDHEKRITALEKWQVERIFAREEATAAWRAMEAAHKGNSDTIEEPLEDQS